MIKLTTSILLLAYLSTCSAEDLTPGLNGPKTKLLVPRFNITGPGPQDYECVSARSADYYGVGVRLGLYFSWWTAWVASASMPDEVSTALDTNTVFLFANLVALVRCTITFVLTQLDGLILMHLAMGTVIGVISNWGYRTCRYKKEGISAMKNFGGIGTHLRLLCSLGTCVYGIWYWYDGVTAENTALEHDDNACRTVWTFMFGKVNAAGPIRIFYIVFSLLWTFHFGLTLLVAPVASHIRFRGISKAPMQIMNELPKDLRLATGLNYKQLRYVFQFLRVFNAFWLFWSMLTIEMTLNYNHVKAVLGPGGRIYFPSQLIPMILGAFTFIRLTWKKFVRSQRGDDSDVPGEEQEEQEEPPSPEAAEQASTPKTIMKVLSPPSPVAKKQKGAKIFKDSDIDSRMLAAPLAWRMLVSYLPWLSLLSRFRQDGTNKQAMTTTSYEPAYDLENRDFWEQETPKASPDPRQEGGFPDPAIQPSRTLPFSRNRNKYTVERFENTIS